MPIIHNASVYDAGNGNNNPGEKIDDAQYNFAGAKDILNAFAEFVCAVSDNGSYKMSATYSAYPAIEQIFTLSKSLAGTNGSNGSNGTNGTNGQRTATLYMYKWSATTPTTFPIGSSTYTWSSATFTDPATLNGWSRTIGTPAGGDKLWRITQTYSDTSTTSTSSVTWTGSYTPEQYTPTLGDLAGLNTIPTAKIDANAVTNLTATFTSGPYTCSDSIWETVQSASYTSTGSPALITFTGLANGGSGTSFGYRITRNGTVVYTGYFTMNVTYNGSAIPATIIDTPSSGSVTYAMQVYVSPGGYGMTVTDRCLTILETKR